MSFFDLSERFSLPGTHLFSYFQIRHFLQKQFPEFPNQSTHSEILLLGPSMKSLITIIHTEIDSIKPENLNYLKLAWEQDLWVELMDGTWEIVLGLVHTSSICARHSIIQCKIL